MITIPSKTIYRCEHCGKRFFNRCLHHEKHCKENPQNKHKCFEFCAHLKKDREFGQVTFTCAVTGQAMYSYIAERRNLVRFFDNGEVRMPLECDKYSVIPESPLGINSIP